MVLTDSNFCTIIISLICFLTIGVQTRRFLMSTKGHRAGSKFGGSHTTVIPLAAIFADIAATDSAVSKITCGIIRAGLRSQRRIKITDIQGGILLSVRDNTTHQEIHIYTRDTHSTKLNLSRAIRNRGVHLCFREPADK